MKFLSVRDLRGKSADVWKELPVEREMIITSNGRPIAILAAISESNLEESLSAFRQARAIEAVASIQRRSADKGTEKITMDEIDEEINAVPQKACNSAMNIVLDTNVLVAGLLSPFGPRGKIVRMVSSGDLTLSLDARILTEYEEVLARPKFKLEKDNISAILDHSEHRGFTVAASPLSQSLPDIDDEAFLEVAIAGQVECLVTGNLVHFPLELCQGVTVLSPGEFLAFYKKRRTQRHRL